MQALLEMTLPKPKLLDLPDEVLCLILSHVSGVDLARYVNLQSTIKISTQDTHNSVTWKLTHDIYVILTGYQRYVVACIY